MRRLPQVQTTILVSTLVRLAMSMVTGYGVDEAYAVTVARPLSLSYFDHPPLHFWIAGLMANAVQSVAPAVERLPFVALFTLTLWAIGQLTTFAFGDRAARVAVLALAISGVLGVVHGSSVLPDGPLLACASLGMLLLQPLLTPTDDAASKASSALWRWCLAGVCFGGAVLSKYHAVLLLLGLLAFMLTHPATRRWWRTPGPWLALGIVLLASVPVVWWNATHHWASFAFQGARGAPRHPGIVPFLENLSGQLLWLLPWIAPVLAMALYHGVRRGRRSPTHWLFTCVSLGPVGVFTVLTLGGNRGLPHWQAPGWLFVFPLVGALVTDAEVRGAVWPRRWITGAVAATATLLVMLLGYLRQPVIAATLSITAERDPAVDLLSWRPVWTARDAAQQQRGQPILLAARSWIQAGQLGAGAPAGVAPTVRCLCGNDARHFGYQPSAASDPQELWLADRYRPDRADWVNPGEEFAAMGWRVVPRDTIALGRGARVVLYQLTRSPEAP
ncbi:MAG: glycosyltransferase family 39 protein [Gemmatimonadaceae bacterium]